MIRLLLALAIALSAVFPATVHAIGPGEALKDSQLESRARDIGRQLRCLVCQNQSIDDSDAPLAQDLRRLVRKRLVAGDTNRQVIAYVHARYGDFVLLRPPMDSRTWILWFGPAIVLLLALVLIVVRIRGRRTRRQQEGALSNEEKARADALLDKPGANA